MNPVVLNNVFNGLLTIAGGVAALPEGVVAIVPAKYKPTVVAIVLIAAWIKSHVNLKADPPK
jgi:hypothetical protein